jgi:hypothetical protein
MFLKAFFIDPAARNGTRPNLTHRCQAGPMPESHACGYLTCPVDLGGGVGRYAALSRQKARQSAKSPRPMCACTGAGGGTQHADRIMGLLRPFCGAAAAGISPPFRLITPGMGPFALSESGPLPVLYTDAGSGPAAAARPVNIGHVPDFAKFFLFDLRRFST